MSSSITLDRLRTHGVELQPAAAGVGIRGRSNRYCRDKSSGYRTGGWRCAARRRPRSDGGKNVRKVLSVTYTTTMGSILEELINMGCGLTDSISLAGVR